MVLIAANAKPFTILLLQNALKHNTSRDIRGKKFYENHFIMDENQHGVLFWAFN